MRSLLIDVSRFMRRHNMAATRFGREAVGDPRFVFDLRKGRECGSRVRAKVYGFIETRERRVGRCV